MEPTIKYTPPVLENITDLTKDTNLPKLYSNGFQCGMTLSDASIVFKLNDVNVSMVTMTIPALKSLFLKMGELMTQYQNALGQPIFSFDELVILTQQAAKAKQTEKDGK